MKKNVGALLLSVVLASGSLGGVTAIAAETVEQQTGEIQEEAEEAVSEDEIAQPVDESGVEDPVQQVEGLEVSEEASEPVEVTDDMETEAAGKNDVKAAENAWESDVTEGGTAEEGVPGETLSDASDTAEPEEIEETGVSKDDGIENSEVKSETDGGGAIQSEAVTVELSEAESAVNDGVKDTSSDLKVAEDAEKLKSGKWKEVTKTVHHAEEGHYETVPVVKDIVDEPAWDEPVYDTVCRCTACGAQFESGDEAAEHVVFEHNNEASWSVRDVQVDTIHHPAKTHKETVYEKQWVVDKAAWDEQVKTGTYQYIVNGKPVKNKLAAIGNETYYFDANGIAVTGWKEVNGSRMYFGSDRKMKTGWLSVSGKKYYLDDNGKVQTGWQTIAGSTYYFNKSDGAMHTKWLQVDGKKYYLDTDGTVHKGWLQSRDKWYYFRVNGEMHTGMLKKDGVYYYLEKDGTRHSGWLQTGGQMYYFKLNGQMLTGWLQKSGKKYYFKTNGQMLTGWLQVNGMKYYFKTSGEMHTGWLQKNGKLYYFKENGQMVTGRYKIGDKWFTFSSDGVKQ